MGRTGIAWLFAILCGSAVGGAVTNADPSTPRLYAFASANDVYVDFAIAAPIVDGLDAGFLELNSVLVTWQIDLRPSGSQETDGPWIVIDRTIRRGTLEIFVSPSTEPGSCMLSRQLNARRIEPRKVVRCADAYRAISAFHGSVFSLTGVTPGSFDVSIRARVTVSDSEKVKTRVLARTKLIQRNRVSDQ